MFRHYASTQKQQMSWVTNALFRYKYAADHNSFAFTFPHSVLPAIFA